MNKKEKEHKKYRILQTISHKSKSGNKRNCCKCWRGVSKEHFIVMCEIVHKLVNQGYEVYTETVFNNGDRADICAISQDGSGYIVEVIKTEPECSYEAKLSTYPMEWEMIKVNSKDFCIDDFDI